MHLDGLSLCLTGRKVDVGGGAPTAKQQQHEAAASCRKLSHFGVSTFSEGGEEGWGGLLCELWHATLFHFFASFGREANVCACAWVCVCHCLAIKIHTAAIFFVPIEPFWIFCRHY